MFEIIMTILALISPALTAGIFAHFFNKKFSKFQSELDINRDKIGSLLNLAGGGKLNRQEIIDQRRFEALDKLCANLRKIDITSATNLVKTFQTLKIDYMFDNMKTNESIRNIFTILLGDKFAGNESLNIPENFNESYLPMKIIQLYRLRINQWKICLGYMQLASMGQDLRKYVDMNEINNDMIKLLPEYSEFIKKHEKYAWLHLYEPVREILNKEIRGFVEETEIDYSTISKEIESRSPAVDVDIAKKLNDLPDEFKNPNPVNLP